MDRQNLITRRDFLGGMTAVTATMAFAPVILSAGASAAVKVIDTHTHFYDPTRPQGVPWPSRNNDLLYKPHLPEQFQTLTKEHGIVGTVVIEASTWLEDNQWVLDLAKENSTIVGFIGNLQLGKPETAFHLERFSANPLFRGVRLRDQIVPRGLGQSAFEDDLRRLSDHKLTLDMVGGAKILPDVTRLAKLVPALRIVINHLPFTDWDQKVDVARRALTEVAQLPNVYAKISEVVRRVDGRVVEDPEFYRPGLDLLWELFGPDRAMYGSNWPVCTQIAPYATVYKVVSDYFSTKERIAAEKFFWRNSLRAYSWKPRGAARNLDHVM